VLVVVFEVAVAFGVALVVAAVAEHVFAILGLEPPEPRFVSRVPEDPIAPRFAANLDQFLPRENEWQTKWLLRVRFWILAIKLLWVCSLLLLLHYLQVAAAAAAAFVVVAVAVVRATDSVQTKREELLRDHPQDGDCNSQLVVAVVVESRFAAEAVELAAVGAVGVKEEELQRFRDEFQEQTKDPVAVAVAVVAAMD